MTLLSIILAFFPALVILLAASSLFWCFASHNLLSFLSLFFILYGFPLTIYRIHHCFYPVIEGISYLQGKQYSAWWGSHQIQVIYIAFPSLEKILRFIPGVFSIWLRLWGAKIGQGIYWNPDLEIADRGLLEIGDRAMIGHRVGIYAHAIKPRKKDLMLYVKKVKIGNHVFLSSGSRIGPGVAIADGTYIPVATDLFPNQKVNSRVTVPD